MISDDYYPALQRPNVNLVRARIERVTRDAIATDDGRTHRADVIVFATGFDTTSFLAAMAIAGSGGRLLSDAWKDGAEAYLGVSVAGFPNLFLMYGPNTNLGHNSMVFMIECQTRYILDCLRLMRRHGIASIDVRAGVMVEYNRRLQAELAGSVWARTTKSWYKNHAGRITNNWSGSTVRYWWLTRRADLSIYERRPAGYDSPDPAASSSRPLQVTGAGRGRAGSRRSPRSRRSRGACRTTACPCLPAP